MGSWACVGERGSWTERRRRRVPGRRKLISDLFDRRFSGEGGSSIGNFRSWMEAACFMTFSRVRLSPHALSTATIVCAAEYP